MLAHHGQAYRSNSANLFGGETYLPAYVRLRVIGCDDMGAALVSRHSGSTSVSFGGGCDAVVAPTLIDWQTGEIVVDSRRICMHIDEAVRDESPSLRPVHLAARIDEEIDLIDNLPNCQMLSGRLAPFVRPSSTGRVPCSEALPNATTGHPIARHACD